MKKHYLFQIRKHLCSVSLSAAMLLGSGQLVAQEKSVAREWNDLMLVNITDDFARPTIHARNLFHTSAAMYDAWAAYEPSHDTWLLGKTRGGYTCEFHGVAIPGDAAAIKAAREEAMSFAVYRIISHRFQTAPRYADIQTRINNYMDSKGYDRLDTSQDYINGGPAQLGNYIAAEILAYGFQDGANEAGGYGNLYYESRNDTIYPEFPGNPTLTDPNLWQPIKLSNAVDQGGNPIFDAPPFLSAEWGDMVPFAMTNEDMVTKTRDGHDWNIYHDPGPPPYLDPNEHIGLESHYKKTFLMVSIWQSHLDDSDTTLWDISPASRGNLMGNYPTDIEDLHDFYNYFDGNDHGMGWDVNPATGLPYEPQIVKRGDYARILAEFWADGPVSYTPTGHWFEILNEAVLDHPDFERNWMGVEAMDDLEYDVKAYFSLGGTVYDAAIAAWSMKGFYDYIRPVSAIRYMCDQGQCTDSTANNYSPAGAPIIPGYVEVVEEGDPLAGEFNQHVGKIKLYTWRGPDYIEYIDPNAIEPIPTNTAGVGWILGENWWPYQRPSFVTPPFSGYISGHSTYSSASAQLLELITGDPFFPGGMGVFDAEQNEFLAFEVGPSEHIQLQWATYRDASDQCSLSRIWGGIHPPVDDIPGRFIGIEIGNDALNHARTFFEADRPAVAQVSASPAVMNIDDIGTNMVLTVAFDRPMDTSVNPSLAFPQDDPLINSLQFVSSEWTDDQHYVVTYELLDGQEKLSDIFVKIDGARDASSKLQNVYLAARPMLLDTDRPEVLSISYNETMLNDDVANNSWLLFTVTLDEESDMTTEPEIIFDSATDLNGTLNYLPENSFWLDPFTFQATYSVVDLDQEVSAIGITLNNIKDEAGNEQVSYTAIDQFNIDTRNPLILDVSVNNPVLNIAAIGNNALQVTLQFDEDMDTGVTPSFVFTNDNPIGTSLTLNSNSSVWLDAQTYRMNFNLSSNASEYFDIQVQLSNFFDDAGNIPAVIDLSDLFIIDTQRPTIVSATPSQTVISDSEVGTGVFKIIVEYGETMDIAQIPVLALSAAEDVSGTAQFNPFSSSWLDEFTFEAAFNITDQNIEVDDVNYEVTFGKDASGNFQLVHSVSNTLSIDTRNPQAIVLSASTYEILHSDIGVGGFSLLSIFDEEMNTATAPEYGFIGPVEVESMLSVNIGLSNWINDFTYSASFDVTDDEQLIENIGVSLSAVEDLAGNPVVNIEYEDYFSINTIAVGINELAASVGLVFYPNPLGVGATLNFKTNEELTEVELQLVNSTGQTVVAKSYRNLPAGQHELQTGELSSGLYIIQLRSKQGISANRIVIME